jgi:3',5'-cyclic AMP phosphodiesterase CpdA
VPGNHDLPLWNALARFFTPWRAWTRGLALPLEPSAETAGLRVAGMNTADPFAWERGRIRIASLDRACALLSTARPGQLRVVALHHPLAMPPGTGKTAMVGAAEAGEALADAGADILLCGHLHQWAAGPQTLREGGRAMLCIQGGTTLSTRLRGEENDFNLIEHAAGTVTVTRYASAAGRRQFTPVSTARFRQENPARGWAPLPPANPDIRPPAGKTL